MCICVSLYHKTLSPKPARLRMAFFGPGPHSSLDAQYTTKDVGSPSTVVAPAPPPAYPGYGSYPMGSVRMQYTNTSDAQRIPSAPFKVLATVDYGKRLERYGYGEILFGVNSFGVRTQNGVQRVKSLWDLNRSLRESHELWVSEFEDCRSVAEAKKKMRDCLTKEDYRYKAESVSNKELGDHDFLELLELSNVTRLDSFLREYLFLGVTIDPKANELSRANALTGQSGVAVFVCEAEGRVTMPNIFRAELPGTEVGLIVTKFNNPHVLGNDANMSWRDILRALQPFQVWPVSNFKGRFPNSGHYTGVNYRLPGGGAPLPSGVGQYNWDNRDPATMQCMYCEYTMSVDGAEIYPDMSFRPAYYFSIGTVEQPVPNVPSVAEITEAVAPASMVTTDMNRQWIKLATTSPIVVHARAPSLEMMRRPYDM